MTREIEFRGKRINNGEYVYGDLIHGQGSNHGQMYILPQTVIYPKGCSDLDGWQITPKTIGQFTGLLDKNGKKIYEGDIVKYIGNDCGDCFISEVKYKGAGFNPIAFMYECGAIDDTKENDQDLHIIGNIHDNPELLKQKSL